MSAYFYKLAHFSAGFPKGVKNGQIFEMLLVFDVLARLTAERSRLEVKG